MRQNNFDFLRFFFAFVVVIGHLIIISQINSFQFLTPFFSTYISVTAFFCISGFLISQSYLKSKSLKSYFQKRAARLLPAYILVILLSGLFLSFVSRYSFMEYFTHPQLLKFFCSNFSFLNFIQPCLPGVFLEEGINCDVNGALWTLKVEISFYLSIPIILYIIEKTKRKYILLIILYLLSVIFKNSFELLYLHTHNSSYNIIARQLPGFLSYFVSGIGIYYYFNFFSKNKIWFIVLGLVILLIEKKLEFEILTPFALAAVVFTIAFSFKSLNSFGKYGDVSYGIYIFHYPIIKTVKSLGFFENYNPVIVSIFLIFIILLTGFISWHFVEKRFIKISHSAR
ncbi:MAG: acyltransferase [Paludibacter sp.]